jgi:polar amino acid transport system substrate-binding protein
MTSRFAKHVALLTLVAAGLVLSAGSHADELDRVEQRGKLIVGIRNDYAPFGYLDANGKLVGFEVDLARFVAKDMFGSEDAIEMVPVVAANRIEFLNAGRIDVMFATLGVTEDRKKVLDYTEYYYRQAGILLLAPKDATYKTWDDVKGKKLCGSQGNTYNRTLIEKYGAELVLFQSPPEIYAAFQDNRCDAIGYDAPNLMRKLKEDGWKDKYKIALDTFDWIYIAGGVRKGEPAFLKMVNDAITHAEAAGLMVEGEKKYDLGESDYVVKRAADAKAALAAK